MTLILRPFGRGNWNTVVVTFNGRRAPRDVILRFRKGDAYLLGETKYRIVGVLT